MEKGVLKYIDPNIKWIKNVINKIDYFNTKDISVESLYKMIYKLQRENYETDELILKEK